MELQPAQIERIGKHWEAYDKLTTFAEEIYGIRENLKSKIQALLERVIGEGSSPDEALRSLSRVFRSRSQFVRLDVEEYTVNVVHHDSVETIDRWALSQTQLSDEEVKIFSLMFYDQAYLKVILDKIDSIKPILEKLVISTGEVRNLDFLFSLFFDVKLDFLREIHPNLMVRRTKASYLDAKYNKTTALDVDLFNFAEEIKREYPFDHPVPLDTVYLSALGLEMDGTYRKRLLEILNEYDLKNLGLYSFAVDKREQYLRVTEWLKLLESFLHVKIVGFDSVDRMCIQFIDGRRPIMLVIEEENGMKYMTRIFIDRYRWNRIHSGIGQFQTRQNHKSLKKLKGIANIPQILSCARFSVKHLGDIEYVNCFVENFIDYPPLEDLLVEPRISLDRAIIIIKRLLFILKQAYARGLIHGDISDTNCRVGKNDEVVILDWGLAQPIGNKFTTVAGSIIPPEAFDKPETERQIPKQTKYEPSWDIYGVGYLLFNLLGGKQKNQRTPRKEWEQNIISGDISKFMAEALPEVRRKFANIVMKTTDDDWRLRYQTADEMISDLDKLLSMLSLPTTDS